MLHLNLAEVARVHAEPYLWTAGMEMGQWHFRADMEELDPKVSAAACARQQRVLRRGMYLSGRPDSF